MDGLGRPRAADRFFAVTYATPAAPARHARRWRPRLLVGIATAAALVMGQAAAEVTAGAVEPSRAGTGFTEPFAGAPQYENLTPREIRNPGQLNQPIGQRAADAIARKLGLRKSDTFTATQYVEFVTGGGVGGDLAAAKLVDASVRILTNTVGRPLYSIVDGRLTPSVLASYGLMVNPDGWLESPANADAATRKINTLLVPGGYLATWCRANGAERSLRMLYRSAYPIEVVYGNQSQQQSDAAQLAPNTKGGVATEVGMSMAPTIWMVNFILIYVLNPRLAAYMPAWWAPVPPEVAQALHASPTGQVPYSAFAGYFS